MQIPAIKLVVFDMAGTTVQDAGEVLACFRQACRAEGLLADDERLNALMGVSKLEVFKVLWPEQLGPGVEPAGIDHLANRSFSVFRAILEDYYRTHPVAPVSGALGTFSWLQRRGIKIALNTGFYRAVTDIILERLGWQNHPLIDFVIASDEVKQGRPAPDMIQRAMAALDVERPDEVIKIGDTPVDLAEGRQAGCRWSLGVVGGSHSRAELMREPNDGLLESVADLPAFLTEVFGL